MRHIPDKHRAKNKARNRLYMSYKHVRVWVVIALVRCYEYKILFMFIWKISQENVQNFFIYF